MLYNPIEEYGSALLTSIVLAGLILLGINGYPIVIKAIELYGLTSVLKVVALLLLIGIIVLFSVIGIIRLIKSRKKKGE